VLSVPITTNVVSSNPAQARCTRLPHVFVFKLWTNWRLRNVSNLNESYRFLCRTRNNNSDKNWKSARLRFWRKPPKCRTEVIVNRGNFLSSRWKSGFAFEEECIFRIILERQYWISFVYCAIKQATHTHLIKDKNV
jgi:hypothetical protein